MVEAKAKKRSIMSDKVYGDNIYDTLIYFDKMNAVMEEADRREFLTHLIEMVEIYEEEQPNGQWLKSITFKLPIIPHDMEISLDNGSQVETVVLLSMGCYTSGGLEVGEKFNLPKSDDARQPQVTPEKNIVIAKVYRIKTYGLFYYK